MLTVASFFVVFQGASDEPYGVYRRYDALVQVGLGTALIALWCSWSVAVVVFIVAQKLPKAWLSALLWVAICLFYLSFSPVGYLKDLEQFVIPGSGLDEVWTDRHPP
ncbi:MAG: hypothetical protein KDA92_00035 [Planctomycetales bacterium]|nr:hypothetical protein [Planctomycetales bacterium]MCA9166014.1 hypothetical protein [Planctomycetales bacterium]